MGEIPYVTNAGDYVPTVSNSEIIAAVQSKHIIPIFWHGATEVIAGGTVNQYGATLNLQSGGVNGNNGGVYLVADQKELIQLVYDNNPLWEYTIYLTEVTASEFSLMIGAQSVPADGASAVKLVGVHVINGALFAISGDGTTKSATDLTTALGAATIYRIKQELVAGALHTWVDGVAKADKATNLPSGALSGSEFVGVKALRVTATLTASVSAFLFYKDA